MKQEISIKKRRAKTLRKRTTFSGIGIHSGEVVEMAFKPAPVGTGILFERGDLPGKPKIAASVKNVIDTSRSTTIGSGRVFVHTVEHVMAALYAAEVDNLIVELSNIEPPIGDGSSLPFVEMIEEAGLVEQEEEILIHTVEQPLFWQEKDISLIILPHPTYKVSYTLSYPGVQVLEAQFHSLELTTSRFKEEIAPCRTFALYEEISHLLDRGLAKGGSLANAVVVCDKAVLSKGGLVFKNEMARHKILDLIGDLALAGTFFVGHIISVRSGHSSNVSFAKILSDHFQKKAIT